MVKGGLTPIEALQAATIHTVESCSPAPASQTRAGSHVRLTQPFSVTFSGLRGALSVTDTEPVRVLLLWLKAFDVADDTAVVVMDIVYLNAIVRFPLASLMS